ncbi:MAG: 2-hydroxyglutaryl-CoA dehydratase [Proteobacteria bacterium]|nr:2-hydroxyglutaryl-CoA dehydratase [Pseudomonadota bacterium]
MIFAGLDIGSLTAKAVLLENDIMIASAIIRVRPSALDSAKDVMNAVIMEKGLSEQDIACCCATGYGRLDIPFADLNMSEISCHGMGAFFTDNGIRTIIDIGGQDCKVIVVNEKGLIKDFIMNDKCAAGTGRSLEMLAKTLDVPLSSLGPLTLKSWRPIDITNKCSIFMELEVLDALYSGKKLTHIAAGLSDAVAKRVASLSASVQMENPVCVTGGVSKNKGVLKFLEKRMQRTFVVLPVDPQIAGALGAAVFAMRSFEKKEKEAFRK